jgi:hypothetical protein
VVPPLLPLYNGLFAFLHWGPHTFTLQVGQQEEIITVATSRHAQPWTLRLADYDTAADRRAQASQSCRQPPIQAVQLPPSGFHSQTHWYLHHHSWSSREFSRKPFFCYHVGRF